MNIRHYLRGLGIGIIVTALILTISGSASKMTDAEIRQRAAQLGMVDGNATTSLNNLGDKASDDSGSNTQEESIPKQDSVQNGSEQTEENDETTPVTESDLPDDGNTGESVTDTDGSETVPSEPEVPASEPETTPSEPESVPESTPGDEVPAAGEMVTVTISSGQSSVAVSKSVANAGLVESASAFDSFLCANGYDKKLKVGTYKIPLGATEEEIAKVITGKLSFE